MLFRSHLNPVGQLSSISDMWIIYDGDDAVAGDPTQSHGDFPDSGDNHGSEGANIAFGDGHAAWVTQKKYPTSFILGCDETCFAPIP